jgi:hypothetical protein
VNRFHRSQPWLSIRPRSSCNGNWCIATRTLRPHPCISVRG